MTGASVPRIDGYIDLDVIGRGGYGIIYRARQETPDRDVAVKVITFDFGDERAERRFRRECDATGQFTGHPNIITVLDSGRTREGLPYLTLPYCPRGSLHDSVQTEGPFPIDVVDDIAIKIARALRDVHRGGIIHRDLKPQNVLLTPWGEPALADFGIATVIDAAQRTGTIDSLTPLHSAPEVLRGEEPTIASDIYSYGSTLATLLQGRAPYSLADNDSVYAVMNRVLTEQPAALPPTTPPHLSQVIAACLSKDPELRPSLDEVISTLDRSVSAAEPWQPRGHGDAVPTAALTSTASASDTISPDADDLPTIQRSTATRERWYDTPASTPPTVLPRAPDDATTESEAAELQPDPMPGPTRKRHGLVAVLAVVAVVLLGGAAFVVRSNGDDPATDAAGESSAPTADELPDPEPLEITETVTPTELPPVTVGSPFQLIGTTAWVIDWSSLTTLDLATGETASTLLEEGLFASSTTVSPDQGEVWVKGSIEDGSDGRLFEVDFATGEVVSRVELPFRPTLMGFVAADRLAVLGERDLVLIRDDGEVIEEIDATTSLDSVVDLALTDDAVWTMDSDGRVTRFGLDGAPGHELRPPDGDGGMYGPPVAAVDLASVGDVVVVSTTTTTFDSETGMPTVSEAGLSVYDATGLVHEIVVPSTGACTLLPDASGLLALCGGATDIVVNEDGRSLSEGAGGTIELWRVDDPTAGTIDLLDRRQLPAGFELGYPDLGYPSRPPELFPWFTEDAAQTPDVIALSVSGERVSGQRLAGANETAFGTPLFQADGYAAFGEDRTDFWAMAD